MASHFLSEEAQEVLQTTLSQIQYHRDEARRLAAAAFAVACTLSGVPEDEREDYFLQEVGGRLVLSNPEGKEDEEDE